MPAVREEELALSGVDRLLPQLAQTLRADEIGRVAFIYSRGGRFAGHDSGRRDGSVGNRWRSRCRSGMRKWRSTGMRLPASVSAAAQPATRRVCLTAVRWKNSTLSGSGRCG
ncbi:hypothetical protein M8494_04785 [Serratia ureilytica]